MISQGRRGEPMCTERAPLAWFHGLHGTTVCLSGPGGGLANVVIRVLGHGCLWRLATSLRVMPRLFAHSVSYRVVRVLM